jgi:hypothetical protein
VSDGLISITTSSRSAFRRCPQKWWWQYVDGYRKRGETPDALWFGIGIHEALASWYRQGLIRGPLPADTFDDWCGDEERHIRASYADHEYGEFDEAKYENARELGTDMLNGYVRRYGRDTDWDVLAIERPFRVKVRHEGRPIAKFMSTWDGVYRDRIDGQVYLMEHKTASAVQLSFLELDDQAGSYWAFAGPILRKEGVLGPDEQIAGITYNYLRKSLGDERPVDRAGNSLNKDGSISKRQPVERYVRHIVERSPREIASQVNRLANEAFLMTEMIERRIPVTKNTSKECTFCEFFTVCKQHERGGTSWKTVMAAEFDQANPFDRYALKSAA